MKRRIADNLVPALIDKHLFEWRRRLRQFQECGDSKGAAQSAGAVWALEKLMADVRNIETATEIVGGA